MGLAMAATTLSGVIETLGDETASVGEKITAVFSALPTILMAVSMGYNALTSSASKATIAHLAEIGSRKIINDESEKTNWSLKEYIRLKGKKIKADLVDVATPGDGAS
jgi:hypothetical protein